MTQHRIFVVDVRDDLPPGAARAHWTGRHGAVFGATPGLRGYLQNRPVDEGSFACSETEFDDRESEREAFGSAYYRDVVVADEAAFLDRDSVRVAVVLAGTFAHGGTARYRAVLPGVEPERVAGEGLGIQSYRLDRPLAAGAAPVVTFVWDDDLEAVRAVVARHGPLAFVAEPRVDLSRSGSWTWAGRLQPIT